MFHGSSFAAGRVFFSRCRASAGAAGFVYPVCVVTPGRIILLVVAFAAVVRAWFLPGIPLILTNDSAYYLATALDIVEGRPVEFATYRTPGYAAFLALVFKVAGVSPVAILMAQHALGVASCGLIALVSVRLAGPRLGLVAGCVAAIDPWLLGYSSFALTEGLTTFLLLAVLTVAVLPQRKIVLRAMMIGGALALLVLVRPAFQVIVPILLLGWLLQFGMLSRRAVLSAGVLAGMFVLAVSPWLLYNHQRGIRGFSGGSSSFIWIGVAGAGFLDDAYLLPEGVRASYEKHVKPMPQGSGKYIFLNQIDAFANPESRQLLTSWAMHSIRQDPQAYAKTFGYALLWQLGWFPRQGVITHSETSWALWRLTHDGRKDGVGPVNVQTSEGPDVSRFAMYSKPGPQRLYFARITRWRDFGAVHVGFLAAALAAAGIGAARGRWMIAAAMMATIAYYAIHAVFLLPYDRFGVPIWIAWYLAPAALVHVIGPKAAAADAAHEQEAVAS